MSKIKGVEGLIPLGTPIGDPINISDADAASLGSYQKRISGSCNINIEVTVAGADAAPKLTLYGSNKPAGPFVPYSALATNYVLPTAGTASFYDADFPPEYLTVKIDKNGGTTGTIVANINVKEKTV